MNHSDRSAAGAAARATAGITPLNGRLIRDRRLALGLSDQVVAEILGTTSRSIATLERGGDQNHLTLEFAQELAVLLGVGLADLLDDPDQGHAVAQADPGGGSDDELDDEIGAEDVAVVGRHLTAAGRTHIDDLARTLGWSSGRARWALHRLERSLADVGQALAWVADSEVEITTAPGPTYTINVLSRRDIRAYGLRNMDAGLLHRLATQGPQNDVTRWDQIALSRLRAAGLVTTDTIYKGSEKRTGPRNDEGARLTDAGRFNLFLDHDTDT
jgi:transcriptional regulator with XRE-family HTH domain